MSAARCTNRIDVADNIGNGDVRRRELLDESAVAIYPCDWRCVASFLDEISRVLRDRCERIVVYFASGNDRNYFVEQRGERTQDARLRLPTETEKYEVVPGKKGIDDLRHHRLFVTKYAFEESAAPFEPSEKVVAQLIFH